MKRKLIIKFTGKACQLFQILELLAKYYGHQTLGEIANGKG